MSTTGVTLPADVARRGAYFLGEEGVAALSPEQARAFTGLLEVGRRLTRELEGELEAAHGLSFSALGVLGRLAAASGGTLRLGAIAQDMGLSLSRVSRIVDALEGRGLLQRRRCAADARATNACLTVAGSSLVCAAQATHRDGVRRRFLAKLDERLLGALVEALDGLLDGSDPACPADGERTSDGARTC